MVEPLGAFIPGGDFQRRMEAVRAGSPAALGQLLESCRPYLLAVANSELNDDLRSKLGASDLVQDTFLNAQREFVDFRGSTEAEILAWLRRILRNQLIDASRRYAEAAKRAVSREQPLDATPSGVAVDSHSPGGVASRREEEARLEQALAQLPGNYRRAIELRHREHQTFAEIGQTLSCSEEAARKLWSRAVERLRETLEPKL